MMLRYLDDVYEREEVSQKKKEAKRIGGKRDSTHDDDAAELAHQDLPPPDPDEGSDKPSLIELEFAGST